MYSITYALSQKKISIHALWRSLKLIKKGFKTKNSHREEAGKSSTTKTKTKNSSSHTTLCHAVHHPQFQVTTVIILKSSVKYISFHYEKLIKIGLLIFNFSYSLIICIVTVVII